MPKTEPDDPIFDALTKLGFELPEHSTKIAPSISTDAKHDQIAFLPEITQHCLTGHKGVFDYDAVIFPALWQNGSKKRTLKPIFVITNQIIGQCECNLQLSSV